ncbi:MAG: BatA and WFA domain-containing protein [Anaerolineales bacterium]|nr:BatA and WFA domain-containing protein [Anaerolineales bacterium]
MTFLTPLGFALASLAIPIILLYMLKLRRKQTPVSSTFLWQKLLREQQANAPWQKLKRNVLLILQLIILAALVTALARPALQVPVVASGSVIVLLDASASMNAADVSPSRFEAGREAALDLVNGLSPASSLTLILVAEKPQTLISAETDKTLLRQALNDARPGNGSADWKSAFALAAGAADANSTTVVISDGGLPQSGLPALNGEVQFIPIGESQDNLAISALALRPAQGIPQLFAEVTNYDSTSREVLLSIYFNEGLIAARRLSIQPNASASLILDNLSNASGIYKATITDPAINSLNSLNSLDSLSLDNTAFAVFQSSSARRVLLVSKGNLFLEQLLASIPGIQPFRALPAADGTLQIPNDPFNLYIFDGIAPPELPDGNLLFVNPPPNPLFEVGGLYNEFENMRVNDHPLARFVNWSAVHILQAKRIETPLWAETLIESDAGPLVFAGETDNRRVAALAFDLRDSDLPLQIAYPILFTNLINYLAPPSAFDSSQSLQPGESLSILPPTDVERMVVASPSGQLYTLFPNEAVFTQTDELGYYAVNFISGDSSAAEYFAVNLFDEGESNIQPRASIQVGRAEVTPTASQKIGQRELWQWLALLALLVLMIEWQAFHRRAFPALGGVLAAEDGSSSKSRK